MCATNRVPCLTSPSGGKRGGRSPAIDEEINCALGRHGLNPFPPFHRTALEDCKQQRCIFENRAALEANRNKPPPENIELNGRLSLRADINEQIHFRWRRSRNG